MKKRITLSFNGETKTISEWCMVYDVYKTTLYNRIMNGWPPEHCLNGRPEGFVFRNRIRSDTTFFTWKGKHRSLLEISEMEGVSYSTMYTRMYRGCTDIDTIVNGKGTPKTRAKRINTLDKVWEDRCVT